MNEREDEVKNTHMSPTYWGGGELMKIVFSWELGKVLGQSGGLFWIPADLQKFAKSEEDWRTIVKKNLCKEDITGYDDVTRLLPIPLIAPEVKVRTPTDTSLK